MEGRGSADVGVAAAPWCPQWPAVCNNKARDTTHHSALLPIQRGEREGTGRGGEGREGVGRGRKRRWLPGPGVVVVGEMSLIAVACNGDNLAATWKTPYLDPFEHCRREVPHLSKNSFLCVCHISVRGHTPINHWGHEVISPFKIFSGHNTSSVAVYPCLRGRKPDAPPLLLAVLRSKETHTDYRTHKRSPYPRAKWVAA